LKGDSRLCSKSCRLGACLLHDVGTRQIVGPVIFFHPIAGRIKAPFSERIHHRSMLPHCLRPDRRSLCKYCQPTLWDELGPYQRMCANIYSFPAGLRWRRKTIYRTIGWRKAADGCRRARIAVPRLIPLNRRAASKSLYDSANLRITDDRRKDTSVKANRDDVLRSAASCHA
jgi:hypothetical protein